MTRERILTTTPDGGVAITCPSEWAIEALFQGAWQTFPWWFGQVQFARMVLRGVPARVAWRYVTGMRNGGLSRAEAIELIRDRDCWPFGTAHEIVDVSEIPDDRTHRDAWRRSRNGGPIWIDEDHARRIDEERLWRAYETA